MDSREILKVPMDPAHNDAEVETIGDYLAKLLLTLWEEVDGFSGKRPFGNSGWYHDMICALAAAGYIKAEHVLEYEDPEYPEDNYWAWEYDDKEQRKAEKMIREAIKAALSA